MAKVVQSISMAAVATGFGDGKDDRNSQTGHNIIPLPSPFTKFPQHTTKIQAVWGFISNTTTPQNCTELPGQKSNKGICIHLEQR